MPNFEIYKLHFVQTVRPLLSIVHGTSLLNKLLNGDHR
jgi:hypothetical protein